MERILVKTNVQVLVVSFLLTVVVMYIFFIYPGFLPHLSWEIGLNEYVFIFLIIILFHTIGELVNARTLVQIGDVIELRFYIMKRFNKRILLDDIILVKKHKKFPFVSGISIVASTNGNKKETKQAITKEFNAFSERATVSKVKSFQLSGITAAKSNVDLLKEGLQKLTIRANIKFASPQEVDQTEMFLQPYMDANMKNRER